MAVFFGEQASTSTPQKENKIMAKDDDMHLRVSKKKKEKIKQRAESLKEKVEQLAKEFQESGESEKISKTTSEHTGINLFTNGLK